MGIPANCTIWHKLEATGAGEKGPASTVQGAPDYVAARFGNGVRVDANGEGVLFSCTNAQMIPNAGCIRVTVKPVGWGCDDGTADDAAQHCIKLGFVDIGGQQFDRLQITNAGLHFYFKKDGVQDGGWAGALVGLDLVDGALRHLAFTWDKDAGLPAGATRHVYLDNVLIGTDSDTCTPPNLPDPDTYVLGNDDEWGGVTPWLGIIDNLQVFDYARTDHSDYLTEGFPDARKMTPQRGYW